MDTIKTATKTMRTIEFKGVWIPAEIWDRPDISWTKKCLLAEIWVLSERGYCFASNDYLSKKMQITRAGLANMLTKLRKKGLICDMVTPDGLRGIGVNFDRCGPLNGEGGVNPTVKGGSPNGEGGVNQMVNIEYSIDNSIDNKKGEIEISHPPDSKKNKKEISNLAEPVTAKKSTGPAGLSCLEFPDGWRELAEKWIQYRKERKPPVKSQMQLDEWMKLLIKYSGCDIRTAKEIISTSIGNGWQGIRPLDGRKREPATAVKMVEYYGKV